ncbi:MAG: hypothetical protein ACI85I_001497 [Arenicella sp.]|jgi:hypothetical protein
MNKITFHLFLGLLLLGNLGYAQDKQFPLEFENSKHDFRIIKEDDGVVSTRFFFQNVNEKTVVISGVFVSCGCTSPEWTERVLKPNDTASISISYDPIDRPEKFEKYIRIEFEGNHEPQFVVIQGNVTPRAKGVRDWFPFRLGNLWFKQSNVFIGTLKKGEVRLVENKIYNNSRKSIEIDFQKSIFPKFIKPLTSKIILAPKDSATFQFEYRSKENRDWGFVTDSVLLMTSDLLNPTKKLEIGVILKEKFEGNTKKQPEIIVENRMGSYDFGTIQQDSTLEMRFTIQNLGNKKLKIRKISSNCDCIEFVNNFSKISRRKEQTLIVRLKPDRLGFFNKRVSIISNDRDNDSLRLELEGEVVE